MAHVKKGHLVPSPEWWKHLRWTKRRFWSSIARRSDGMRTLRRLPETSVIVPFPPPNLIGSLISDAGPHTGQA